ncbi:double-stranded RNA-specific editase 1-like isoform X4 [Eriocheir sinensis]|uniref:double-stranded RNA-specific editase 1-like isoform X4 n=1 Tax=Eriocheir sinensis TaxID=95602 RepID=UPI0021C6824F|nr:double-stranded RNA-specific editase 1-like isoform X4 [Eriocheir sinensis]
MASLVMSSEGRGRNWRSAPAPPVQEPDNQVESFPAPALNESSNLDYYQQDVAGSDMANEDLNSGHDMDVKMEGGEGQAMVSDSDASMQEGEHQQTETRKRPWEKPGGRTNGIKVKRKKVPGAKNLKIRRYVQPKNAVMCLNELRPGVTYTTEQEGGVGQPFCISVEIDGQKYRGFGSSKQLAKQAAAEAALISFVKPPVTTTESQEEDKTPWATLASFAIYKLFNDWREGRVGMCPPPSQPYGAAIPPGVKAFLSQPLGAAAAAAAKEDSPQAAAFTEAICAHLGGRAPNTPAADPKSTEPLNAESKFPFQSTEPVKVPNPAKQIPESAAAMHPVMVLHQMKPGLQYNITQTTRESKPFFTVTSDIDGKEFSGEGSNVKKAKFFLAKAAILGLYGVESTFEVPA